MERKSVAKAEQRNTEKEIIWPFAANAQKQPGKWQQKAVSSTWPQGHKEGEEGRGMARQGVSTCLMCVGGGFGSPLEALQAFLRCQCKWGRATCWPRLFIIDNRAEAEAQAEPALLLPLPLLLATSGICWWSATMAKFMALTWPRHAMPSLDWLLLAAAARSWWWSCWRWGWGRGREWLWCHLADRPTQATSSHFSAPTLAHNYLR